MCAEGAPDKMPFHDESLQPFGQLITSVPFLHGRHNISFSLVSTPNPGMAFPLLLTEPLPAARPKVLQYLNTVFKYRVLYNMMVDHFAVKEGMARVTLVPLLSAALRAA